MGGRLRVSYVAEVVSELYVLTTYDLRVIVMFNVRRQYLLARPLYVRASAVIEGLFWLLLGVDQCAYSAL